jgi:hypothetical protein
MAPTYKLIATAGAGGQIEFSSIPQTYNDLLIKFSHRATGQNWGYVTINGGTYSNGYTKQSIYGNGSGSAQGGGTSSDSLYIIWTTWASTTANTFSYTELYIPSYNTNKNKTMLIQSNSEDMNAGGGNSNYIFYTGMNWGFGSAITSLTITPWNYSGGEAWVTGTTAYLYGIVNG